MTRLLIALWLVGCSHARWGLGPPGTQVTLRGRIATTPWQHMMTNVAGKEPGYFDLDAEHQTVVYWTAAPACADVIEISGVVIEASGPAKRTHDDPPSTFTERSVDVATARCVE